MLWSPYFLVFWNNSAYNIEKFVVCNVYFTRKKSENLLSLFPTANLKNVKIAKNEQEMCQAYDSIANRCWYLHSKQNTGLTPRIIATHFPHLTCLCTYLFSVFLILRCDTRWIKIMTHSNTDGAYTSAGKHYETEPGRTRKESSAHHWVASQRLGADQRDRVEKPTNCVPSAPSQKRQA